MSPNTNLQDGVSYTLSDGQGEINIGFNDSDSVSDYDILDDKIVTSGEGSETFTVETIAKDRVRKKISGPV